MANTLYEYYQSLNQPLPSLQARQSTAQQAGISNYSGTAQQNIQLLSYLQGNNTGTNGQTTMNAGQLGGNSGLNIPNPVPVTSPNAVIGGLPDLAAVQNIDVTKSGALGQANQQMNQLGAGQLAAQRRALELSGQLENKSVREGELQQQNQLLEKQNLQAQAAQKIQELKKSYLAEQVAVAGRPIGLERQGGKLDQLRRREAIDLLSQSIVLDAATGDVEAAQRNIDNALKLEFEPIEAKIETTKLFLQFNQDNFNRVEKQQAQALQIKLDREKQAIDAYRKDKDDLLKVALAKGDNDAIIKILGSRSSSDLSKITINMKAEASGVPSDIAEKIGESKIGQKVNASIDLVNSLTSYKNMYKKYADAGQLKTVEAQKNLGTLRGNLEQVYSVANGQGAVQTGDRDSYQKIIQGGIFSFFPQQVVGSLDTLIGTLNSTTQNDLKYLDQTYQGYATLFFQPQLTQNLQPVTTGNETGKSFFDLMSKNLNINPIYSPSTGFNIPKTLPPIPYK